MQNLLAQRDANEALKGNKQFNTFKSSSSVRVAEVIGEQYGTKCTPKKS